MYNAVFLDRDGTISVNRIINHPHELELLPGIVKPLLKLQLMAYKLVIVTNQGGLSLGHITENDLDHIHTRLLSMLKEKGILIDMILAAGWHEKGHIKKYSPAWRKPEPGMLLHAAGALNIDLDASFMIGDRLSDIKAGQRAGCRTIYVRTGEEENLADLPVQPDFNASNLAAAADFILQDLPVEPPDSRYDPKES